jgi:hypothetical protein
MANVINLPVLPEGRFFEEYISAYFQSGGYYIERNITESQVLELDIIATDYNTRPPRIKLIEVKSGDWGFSDLFKVRGWMCYLDISDGIFIVRSDKDKMEDFKEKARKLNIVLISVSDMTRAREVLSEVVGKTDIDEIDIETWRYSYWVERNLLKRLNHYKKTQKGKRCFSALEEYFDAVNNEIFFIDNNLEKAIRLYSAFEKYPRISAKTGYEIIGDNFDIDYDRLPKEVYEDTYYKCNYNAIQISTFVEHKARLAIMKSAIDYKLYKEAGIGGKVTDKFFVKMLGSDFETALLNILPESFKEGLNKISMNPHFHRYPIFWQWFMWIFGGFILKDYEEKEYEILSQKTGIPKGEIPSALESYEILFPQNDGWFLDLSPNLNIKLMKMFPVPFMGIGANYRRLIYTESKKFEDLKLGGTNTIYELKKWNNLTVDVLSVEH